MIQIPRNKPPDMLDAEWVARHLEIREPNVFNPGFLEELKAIVIEIAGRRMDRPVARMRLAGFLKRVGYTPEGGFVDDRPEWKLLATTGSIDDLGSPDRLDWTIRYQESVLMGAGDKFAGEEGLRLELFPAWKLSFSQKGEDVVRKRWNAIGGRTFLPLEGESQEGSPFMIAAKHDPVWEQMGDPQVWPDGLGIDHPPFYLDSELSWVPVARAEAVEYGVIEAPTRVGTLTEAEMQTLERIRVRRIERRIRRRQLEEEAGQKTAEAYAERNSLANLVAKEKARRMGR